MRPTDLRGILQYVPQFREKTFVIAVDGAIVTDENFGKILMDVAVLWSLRIRVVLVHGASAQIRVLAAERSLTPSDLDGSGVTDAETLKLALMAANRLTHEILEGLSASDLRAASTNAVFAHPMGILHGVDHLFTGRVERIDVELVESLLAQGVVPVVAPLGFDRDGHSYRVNSDSVALELAKALGAVKLIYITTKASDSMVSCCGRSSQVSWQRRSSGVRSQQRSSQRRATRSLPAMPACRACTSSTAASRRGCSQRCSPTRALARWSTSTSMSRSAAPAVATRAASRC